MRFILFFILIICAMHAKSQNNQTRTSCVIEANKKACQKLIEEGLPNVYECDVLKECAIVGVIYVNAGRESEGLPYFSRIHEANELESYNLQGLFYKQKKDYTNARKQFEIACNKSLAKSCFNLATLYENALGVKRDSTKAISLYEMSCNSGISEACYNLAVLYINTQNDKNADENLQKAKQYLKKSCDAKYEDACELVDRM